MPPDFDDVPTRECPSCHSTVPAATFCGECGAQFQKPIDRLSTLLRPAVYANAPRESVWLPRVTSALFPRLAGPARKPFRLGLIATVTAVVVLSAMAIQGPLGAISVIGWPLIFLIYVWESDSFRDIPLRILLTAMLLGTGLGIATWLTVGRLIAGSYGLSTGASLVLLGLGMNVGFLISVAAAALMLIPTLVTRLFPMSVRESLDGFVVGAFGALWFSTAASTTILTPRFVQGLMEQQDAGRLFEDSLTYGIVSTIVTTAAGGVLGIALWFQPDRRAGRDPRRARLALAICAALAFASYIGVWAIDGSDLPRMMDVAGKLVLAVFAIVVVRCAVQIALLHETPDPADGAPVLCVHCERVVPNMPFCVACGSAARASSRTSRRLRSESPPVRAAVGD
jgi:hypothetical protein